MVKNMGDIHRKKVVKSGLKTSSNKTVNKTVKIKKEKQVDNLKKNSNVKRKVEINFLKLFRFIFIVILMIASTYAIYFICTSSKFDIANINISGNFKYTVDEILNNTGIFQGENIVRLKKSKVINNLKKLPYIENIKVTKKLPNSIDIEVVERASRYIAFDKDTSKFYKLSNKGVILEDAIVTAKTEDELLIYGITFDIEVTFGNLINDSDLSKLAIYNEIEQEYEKQKLNFKITRVNFENSLTTIILDDKLSIVLPNNTNLQYNMVFVSNIITQLSDDLAGVIDMTKTDPVFVKN